MKTTLCLLQPKNMFSQTSAWSHAYGRPTANILGDPGS